DLAGAHRVDAVLDRELHPAHLEVLALELRANAFGHGVAQLDRIALRLAVAVGVREPRPAADVAERDHAALADLVQGLSRRRKDEAENGQEQQANQHGHLLMGAVCERIAAEMAFSSSRSSSGLRR